MAVVIGFLLGGLVGFSWAYSGGYEWQDSAVYMTPFFALLGMGVGALFLRRPKD